MADREALDALQQDAADHQRRFSGEVTAESNRVLLATELARIDNMAAEQPVPSSQPEPPPPPVEPTIGRREVAGREYLMSKGPDDKPMLRTATPLEAEFLARALPRIEMLVTKHESGPLGQPSWRDRVLAVLQTKSKAAAWHAASQAPEQLAESRRTLKQDQALLKVLGLETISQLTPAFARAKAAEFDRQYLAELLQILEDSSAIFGDWKKPPETKLVFGA